jgi:hypothetical protein
MYDKNHKLINKVFKKMSKSCQKVMKKAVKKTVKKMSNLKKIKIKMEIWCKKTKILKRGEGGGEEPGEEGDL